MGRWIEVILSKELLGERFVSGTGFYEKEYVYINIPDSDKYNHYCFQISAKLVDDKTDTDRLYLSFHSEAKFVLQKSREYRNGKKRYKRYELTGKELYAEVLEACEDTFLNELYKKEEEKIRMRKAREKRIMGKIVYGKYTGNNYGYVADEYNSFFFKNIESSTYFNSIYEKVSNVEVIYCIDELVSKDFFRENVSKLHEKLNKWLLLNEVIDKQNHLMCGLDKSDLLYEELSVFQNRLKEEMDKEIQRVLSEE